MRLPIFFSAVTVTATATVTVTATFVIQWPGHVLMMFIWWNLLRNFHLMIDVSDGELQKFRKNKTKHNKLCIIILKRHSARRTMICLKGVKGQTPSKRGRRARHYIFLNAFYKKWKLENSPNRFSYFHVFAQLKVLTTSFPDKPEDPVVVKISLK